jgi:hypothetical protein
MTMTIKSRITAAARAAAELASRGRRPRSAAGDPFTLSLAACAVDQRRYRAATGAVESFLAAWRLAAPAAADVASARFTLHRRRVVRDLWASASESDWATARAYGSTTGRARKSFRRRHHAALARTGAIATA